MFVYTAPVRVEILQKEGLWSHRHGAPAEPAGFGVFDVRRPVTVTVRPARAFHTAAVRDVRVVA